MHAPYPMMAPPALLGGASEEGRWKIASLGEAVDAAISDTLGALLALRDLVLYPIWQLAFLDHPFVLSIADRLLAVFALGTSDGIAGDVGLFLRLAGLAFVLALLHRTGAPLSTKLLLVGVAMGPSLLGLSPAPAHVLALTRGVLLGFVFVAGASLQPAAWREAPAYPLAAWLLAGTIVVALPLLIHGIHWGAAVFTGAAVAVGPLLLGARAAAGPGNANSQRRRLTFDWSIAGGVVILLTLLLPLLQEPWQPLEALRSLFAMVALFALALIFAQQRIPEWFSRLKRQDGADAIPLAIAVLCLPILLVAELIGLGLASGCFLAGIALSRSVVQLGISATTPLLRQALASAFYVLLGLLLDVGFLWRYAPYLLATMGACLLLGYTVQKAMQKAMGWTSDVDLSGARPGAGTPSVPLLLAGALGLFIVLTGSESGLSPAGLGAAGEQAFIAVTVLLTIVAPLPENIRRWRGRRATSAPPSQRQSPNVADGAIGDRPSQIHPGSVLRRRAAHYLLRRHPALSGATPSMHDSALGIITVGYGAPAEGLQLRQLEKWLLLRYELTIPCVWRGDVVLLPGEAGCCLREGDRVIVSGRREHVAESRHLFHSIRPGMR